MRLNSMKKAAPAILALTTIFATQAAQAKYVFIRYHYKSNPSWLVQSYQIAVDKRGQYCYNYKDSGKNLNITREIKTKFTVPDNNTKFTITLFPNISCGNTLPGRLPQITSSVAAPPQGVAVNGSKYTYVWLNEVP